MKDAETIGLQPKERSQVEIQDLMSKQAELVMEYNIVHGYLRDKYKQLYLLLTSNHGLYDGIFFEVENERDDCREAMALLRETVTWMQRLKRAIQREKNANPSTQFMPTTLITKQDRLQCLRSRNKSVCKLRQRGKGLKQRGRNLEGPKWKMLQPVEIRN